MEFNIKNIKTKMLIEYPYFGTITTNVTFYENNAIPTACTDGFDVYYSKEFMDKLDEKQQIFIIAHEICHIAFNHINRAVDKVDEIWNIATDAVINAFLKEDGLTLVPGVIDLPWASKFNAEELYDFLKQNYDLLQDIKNELMKQNSKLGEDSKSFGHDSHLEWKNIQKKDKNSSNSSNNSKENVQKEQDEEKENGTASEKIEEEKECTSISNSDDERRRKKRIQNEQEELAHEGEKNAFDKNKDDKKEMLNKMKEDLLEEATGHQAGNQAGEYQRKVIDIGKKSKIVDWRYFLRESIKFDLDWSYKNATIEDGVLHPNLEDIPKPEVEIVLDTSGSIDEELLKNFLRECKNIMSSSKVKVGCFDTKFYGFHEIRNEYDIEHMPFEGGGGTNFDVAVGAFTRKVVNRIIFTDGYANMPKKNMQVIWVVIGDSTIDPPGGKVIYINREIFDKKYNNKQYIISR